MAGTLSNRPFGTHPGRPSFEEACKMYQNRYTMEHVPLWAAGNPGNGRFYAPQFRTDREWYDNTLFPGEDGHLATGPRRNACMTSGQTWPLGLWLDEPYRKGETPLPAAGPRVAVTLSAGGHAEGREFETISEAAVAVSDWVMEIPDENVGVDYSISIELLDDD